VNTIFWHLSKASGQSVVAEKEKFMTGDFAKKLTKEETKN